MGKYTSLPVQIRPWRLCMNSQLSRDTENGGTQFANDALWYSADDFEALKAERDKLRAAIKYAGFAVMETSGDWSIHDVSELGKREQEKTMAVISENVDLTTQLAQAREELHRAKDRVERLKDFVVHNDDCPARFPSIKIRVRCTCGLEEILK